MKKSQNHTRIAAISLLALFIFLLITSCAEQKASSVKEEPLKTENSEKASSTVGDIKAAEDLIKKAPDVPGAYNQLAIAYIHAARESGDFSLNSKAETAASKALELEPDNAAAQKLQASLHLTFHRFPEALEAGIKLQRQFSRDAMVYGILTDANVELGNYEAAVENAQKMVDTKPNMESYARVSHIRSLYGDTDGAIKAMTQAAEMTHPMDKEGRSWCLVRLGNEYFKAGRYQEAEAAYDTALKAFPTYHLALAGKGQARMAAGDYESAIKFLTQSQNRVPLTDTVIALGNVYKKIGNLEKAIEQYKLVELIEQKLGLNYDQRSLMLLWADQDMRLDEALEIAAREHDSRKDVYTADVYAWCLYKKGRYEEAKEIIGEAMRIKNKDARIFYHAGMIEKALNNKTQARKYLQTAVETNPAFDLLQADVARKALQEVS